MKSVSSQNNDKSDNTKGIKNIYQGVKLPSAKILKRLAFKTSASLLAIFLILLILETCVRYLLSESKVFSTIATKDIWEIMRYLPGDTLAFDLQPDVVSGPFSINSIGLRDSEDDLNKKFRKVLIAGDSYTFGHGIYNRNQVWTEVLEKRIAENISDVRVLNMGVPGYNTVQEVERFSRISRIVKAEAVILAWHTNDEDDTPIIIRKGNDLLRLQYGTLPESTNLGETGTWLLSRSALFRRVALYFFRFQYAREDDFEQRWRRQRQFEMLKAMERMNSICKAKSIKPAIVLIPSIPELGSQYPWRQEHKMVSHKAEEMEWIVLDLSAPLSQVPPENITFIPEDTHPNAEGHKMIAEAVMPVIQRLLQR